MSGWMNSSGHRENILNSAYKSMGVGCFVHNGTYYWVQLFSKSSASYKSTKTGFVNASPTITAITDNLAFSRSSYSTSNPRIITYNKNKGSSKYALYALVAPSTFKWTSSNTSVATVDSTGLITIKSTGTTVITRTFASNTNIYLQFTLEPYLDLADAVIEAIPNQLYTGSAIYPQPKVTYQGKTLNLGTDYTLSYVNNIYASDNAQLTINGMGAYSGKQTVYFTIYKASFQNVTPSSYDVTYTGQTDNLVKFTVTNTLGEVLTEGVHYTVEYKIYERQKTIVATVLGIYPYNCSETVYLNLKMLSIADAEVTVPSKVVLTGICVQPTPTVTYNGKVLTKGTDYTVGYSNNCAYGTGYVYIYGTGSYSSYQKVAFQIVSASSALTAPVLKAKAYYNKVKLSWNAVPYADGYVIYRKTGSGSFKKIKTIQSGSTVSYTDKKKSLNKKYTYYIQAYKGYAYSNASQTVKVTTKLSRPTLKVQVKNNKHVLTWSKVSGASGYIIYRKTGSGSYKKVKTISAKASRKCTLRTQDGVFYSYKIKPYRLVSGKKKVSNVSKVKTAYGY